MGCCVGVPGALSEPGARGGATYRTSAEDAEDTLECNGFFFATRSSRERLLFEKLFTDYYRVPLGLGPAAAAAAAASAMTMTAESPMLEHVRSASSFFLQSPSASPQAAGARAGGADLWRLTQSPGYVAGTQAAALRGRLSLAHFDSRRMTTTSAPVSAALAADTTAAGFDSPPSALRAVSTNVYHNEHGGGVTNAEASFFLAQSTAQDNSNPERSEGDAFRSRQSSMASFNLAASASTASGMGGAGAAGSRTAPSEARSSLSTMSFFLQSSHGDDDNTASTTDHCSSSFSLAASVSPQTPALLPMGTPRSGEQSPLSILKSRARRPTLQEAPHMTPNGKFGRRPPTEQERRGEGPRAEATPQQGEPVESSASPASPSKRVRFGGGESGGGQRTCHDAQIPTEGEDATDEAATGEEEHASPPPRNPNPQARPAPSSGGGPHSAGLLTRDLSGSGYLSIASPSAAPPLAGWSRASPRLQGVHQDGGAGAGAGAVTLASSPSPRLPTFGGGGGGAFLLDPCAGGFHPPGGQQQQPSWGAGSPSATLAALSTDSFGDVSFVMRQSKMADVLATSASRIAALPSADQVKASNPRLRMTMGLAEARRYFNLRRAEQLSDAQVYRLMAPSDIFGGGDGDGETAARMVMKNDIRFHEDDHGRSVSIFCPAQERLQAPPQERKGKTSPLPPAAGGGSKKKPPRSPSPGKNMHIPPPAPAPAGRQQQQAKHQRNGTARRLLHGDDEERAGAAGGIGGGAVATQAPNYDPLSVVTVSGRRMVVDRGATQKWLLAARDAVMVGALPSLHHRVAPQATQPALPRATGFRARKMAAEEQQQAQQQEEIEGHEGEEDKNSGEGADGLVHSVPPSPRSPNATANATSMMMTVTTTTIVGGVLLRHAKDATRIKRLLMHPRALQVHWNKKRITIALREKATEQRALSTAMTATLAAEAAEAALQLEERRGTQTASMVSGLTPAAVIAKGASAAPASASMQLSSSPTTTTGSCAPPAQRWGRFNRGCSPGQRAADTGKYDQTDNVPSQAAGEASPEKATNPSRRSRSRPVVTLDVSALTDEVSKRTGVPVGTATACLPTANVVPDPDQCVSFRDGSAASGRVSPLDAIDSIRRARARLSPVDGSTTSLSPAHCSLRAARDRDPHCLDDESVRSEPNTRPAAGSLHNAPSATTDEATSGASDRDSTGGVTPCAGQEGSDFWTQDEQGKRRRSVGPTSWTVDTRAPGGGADGSADDRHSTAPSIGSHGHPTVSAVVAFGAAVSAAAAGLDGDDDGDDESDGVGLGPSAGPRCYMAASPSPAGADRSGNGSQHRPSQPLAMSPAAHRRAQRRQRQQSRRLTMQQGVGGEGDAPSTYNTKPNRASLFQQGEYHETDDIGKAFSWSMRSQSIFIGASPRRPRPRPATIADGEGLGSGGDDDDIDDDGGAEDTLGDQGGRSFALASPGARGTSLSISVMPLSHGGACRTQAELQSRPNDAAWLRRHHSEGADTVERLLQAMADAAVPPEAQALVQRGPRGAPLLPPPRSPSGKGKKGQRRTPAERALKMTASIWRRASQHVAYDGDGNGLFRALAHQLFGSEDQHPLVRHTVVRYMRAHAARLYASPQKKDADVDGTAPDGQDHRPPAANATTFASSPPSAYDFSCLFSTCAEAVAYLNAMADSGTWGDELCLFAAAQAFHVRVHVLTTSQSVPYLFYEPLTADRATHPAPSVEQPMEAGAAFVLPSAPPTTAPSLVLPAAPVGGATATTTSPTCHDNNRMCISSISKKSGPLDDAAGGAGTGAAAPSRGAEDQHSSTHQPHQRPVSAVNSENNSIGGGLTDTSVRLSPRPAGGAGGSSASRAAPLNGGSAAYLVRDDAQASDDEDGGSRSSSAASGGGPPVAAPQPAPVPEIAVAKVQSPPLPAAVVEPTENSSVVQLRPLPPATAHPSVTSDVLAAKAVLHDARSYQETLFLAFLPPLHYNSLYIARDLYGHSHRGGDANRKTKKERGGDAEEDFDYGASSGDQSSNSSGGSDDSA